MNVAWETREYGPSSIDRAIMGNMPMSYPHVVEISNEHDGVDIEDWLIESGMAHITDWKAINMRHRKKWVLYFKDPAKAVMAKLRWGGIGF